MAQDQQKQLTITEQLKKDFIEIALEHYMKGLREGIEIGKAFKNDKISF